MKVVKIIMYAFISLSLNSCFAQDCESLPNNFKTYKAALNAIETANYNYHESIDTKKSSWIIGLTYYSCDNKKGFLVMETKKEKYIHQDIPVSIWRELKQAPSFGSYYNHNIKGKYKVRLY